MNHAQRRSVLAALALSFSLAACSQQSDVSTQNSSSTGSSSTSSSGQMVTGPVSVIAPTGTVYDGKLKQNINTKTSREGDTFQLVQTDTLFHKTPALHGATIEGHLANVQPAGPGRKPGLTLVFDDIILADGKTEPIAVKVESFKAFEPKSHHFRTLAMMTTGAIIGQMAAKHTGHHHGTLGGAMMGYMLSQELKTDIDVPAGTILQLRFLSPVILPSSNSTQSSSEQ